MHPPSTAGPLLRLKPRWLPHAVVNKLSILAQLTQYTFLQSQFLTTLLKNTTLLCREVTQYKRFSAEGRSSIQINPLHVNWCNQTAQLLCKRDITCWINVFITVNS
jgi:hypothetical protein